MNVSFPYAMEMLEDGWTVRAHDGSGYFVEINKNDELETMPHMSWEELINSTWEVVE